MLEHYENLKRSYNRLLEMLEQDDAVYASTQLHYVRERMIELRGTKNYLLNHSLITPEESLDLKDIIEEIECILQTRLQCRIFWIARGIDNTIEERTQNGTYKGEFTTSMILANAFNDIIGDTYGKLFEGKR